MIPRIIFSRSCASRHLLFQNRAHVASEGHYFHSPFPILYAKSNVSSNQSRNFSVSNLKNNVFNFWGETKDVNVKQEENVFIDVSNNQTVSDQTLNSSTLSSNVDDISSNQILLPDVDGVSSELSSDMLESVPDATTFADLGLGGSILPHKLLQDIFEYLNTTVGLEWIPAIAIVTLVIRTLALPCYVNMRRFSVRSNNLFPESFKLQQAMQKAAAEKNKFIMKKCHIEYQTFLQKNNINPLKPLIINIPNMIFFSSMFIGLRQMCEAHVPSLVNGGILWFQNLSISDPYMILPVLSCLSMAAIIRSGAAASELGPAGEIKGIRKILMWTPVIGLPFLIYQPSAIFIFWITSMQIEQLIFLLLPSVLWGVTNPLLKQGSSGIENVHSRNKLNEIFFKLLFIISHWKCFLPFLINQLGSVAYFYALKTIDISIGVPVVNSLTLVITTLTGRLVAGEKYQPKTILGMIFIITGVSLCMLDSIN